MQRTLRTWYALLTWVNSDGHAKRAGGGFEDGFGDVMTVGAMVQHQVQVHQSVAGNSRPEFLNQLRIEVTDLFRQELDPIHKRHSPAEIYGGCYERFFHRKCEMPVATDPRLVTDGLIQGSAKTNANVFHCMVLINVQIARRLDVQIKQSMSSEQRQHVIKETDASGNLRFSTAIEIDRQLNLSFSRVAFDGCRASH